MNQLTLAITIDSSRTDGNPTSWEWQITGASAANNPPPRMSISDVLTISVTDSNPSSVAALDAYMILGPKVENPLTGVTGKASPLKQGNSPGGNAACVASWSGIQPNGTQFTFSPPNNTFLESGAWELTFVVSRPDTATQFELDPEFDVGS